MRVDRRGASRWTWGRRTTGRVEGVVPRSLGFIGFVALAGLTACAEPTATPMPTATPTATHTPAPPTATPTATLTPTPDPYAGWTIEDLAAREHGAGELTVERTLGVTGAFTRTLISYPSGDLRLYGFMNEPPGPGPHPVVLVLHGYVNPASYQVQTYTARYADALAQSGYLAIHPNYRNHPPSDSGENQFRAGYAIDVLDLAGIVRRTAGEPGPLARADGADIALWGHSMGGGIALRVAAVDPEIDAVVLYGSTSAEDRLNFERWGGPDQPEMETSEADLERISPVYHLDRIQAEIAVHHGDLDRDVPLAWSEDLCRRLEEIGKPADCYTYAGQGHIFWGEADTLFLERSRALFDQAFAGD